MKLIHGVTAAGLLLAAAVTATAQNYSITPYVIGGGGGTSSGGAFSLSGTIGQPATSTMSGGNYTLASGFWSMISILQTPGAPVLTIVRSGGNATLSWPSSATGFVLEKSGSLLSGSWTAQGGTVSAANGTNSVTVQASPGYQFFRLHIPTP